MKAEAGEMHYDCENFYHYGKILLENQHPVLRKYLIQRKDLCMQLFKKLDREGRIEERTQARLQEIKEEIPVSYTHLATVHFVDEGTDTGPIILQKAVEVREGDTPEILQRRVMEEAEWEIMPRAIDLIANDRIQVADGLVKRK